MCSVCLGVGFDAPDRRCWDEGQESGERMTGGPSTLAGSQQLHRTTGNILTLLTYSLNIEYNVNFNDYFHLPA